MAKHPIGLDPYQTEFVKLIRANAHRHRVHEVFRDFCELAALSLSNSVDSFKRAEREDRYLHIVGKYEREEVERFPVMLAQIVMSLEERFHDCLGGIFMALELFDHWKGQFFTPYEVSYLMAKLTLGDLRAQVERQGFITINEPCVGAGAMVIAQAHAARDQGVNFQQAMHVVAVDIDATAVHMAYIQLFLLHIPAIVVHGNSLSLEEWDHWSTAAHVWGCWDWKLHRRARGSVATTTEEASTEATQAEAVAADEGTERTEDDESAAPLAEVRKAIIEARLSNQLDLF